MNVRKILTSCIEGMVAGSKYSTKLSDCNVEANFIDDITDPYMEIIYNLEPLDTDDMWDAITDATCELGWKGEATYSQDIGIDKEEWIHIKVKSVEELVDLIMAEFFPHIKEENV